MDFTSNPASEELEDFIARMAEKYGANEFMGYLHEEIQKAIDNEGSEITFNYLHRNFYLALEDLVHSASHFRKHLKSTKSDVAGYKRSIEFKNGSRLCYVGGE